MTPDAWSDADWQDRAAAGRDLGGRHLGERPARPRAEQTRREYDVTVHIFVLADSPDAAYTATIDALENISEDDDVRGFEILEEAADEVTP